MKTKKCFKCGETKLIDKFYKHPRMLDGHLGKCAECTKKDVRLRESVLKKSPEWVEKERKRGLDKYVRLYRKSKKPYPSYVNNSGVSWDDKFPEKKIAASKSQHVKPPKGKVKHHWSYNEIHYKDVIFLTKQEHYQIHRYTIYDQEQMMYRTLAGVLLDSKEKHLKYFKAIRDLE